MIPNALLRASPRIRTGVVWCVLLLMLAWLLARPSVTLPADAPGIRRFQTAEIAPDVRLAQTFTMTANGLHAIDVQGASMGATVSGLVRLELYDITREAGPRPLVRVVEIPAADLVAARSYRFEFPPILDSQDRVYRLDFVSSETRPARGVGLVATKGDRYAGGALVINGAVRWADIAFRTHAPAPSIGRLLMSLRGTNPIRFGLVLAAFVALVLLVPVVLRAMLRLSETAHAG